MKMLIGLLLVLLLALAAVWVSGTKFLGDDLARYVLIGLIASLLLGAVVLLVWWIVRLRRAARVGDDPLSRAAATERARLDALRASLRHLDHHLKLIHDPPRRFFSAKEALPRWMVVGGTGHGKTSLVDLADPATAELLDTGVSSRPILTTLREDLLRLFVMRGRGVFFEVPDALAQREPLRRAWLASLRLLRRARRGQPIDAVLLTVSLVDLLAANDGESIAIARSLGATLRDVCEHLKVQVPVYLILTKFDRVAGFTEVLGALDPVKPFGFELPELAADVSRRQQVQRGLGTLGDWIAGRSLALLSQEPDPGRQSRIYTLPQQHAEISRRVDRLLANLHGVGLAHGETLRLFGLYFISTAQEPSVVAANSILAARAQYLGISRALRDVGVGGQTQGRRFHVDAITDTILVRERRYATRTRRHRWFQLGIGVTGAAAGIVLAGYIGFGTTESAEKNLQLLQDTADAARPVAGEMLSGHSTTLSFAPLQKLRGVFEKWRAYSKDGPPSNMGFGLFRGDAVQEQVQRLFLRALREGVLRILVERAGDDLRKFASRYEPKDTRPDEADRRVYLQTLRSYLLMTSPKETYEHTVAGEWPQLHADLAGWWAVVDRSTAEQDADAMLGTYVDVQGRFEFERDSELVSAVRQIFLRFERDDAVIQEIVAVVSKLDVSPSLTLGTMTNASHITDNGRAIRGSFTQQGAREVYERIRQEVAHDLGDAWVLGITEKRAAEEGAGRCARLQSVYFGIYIKEWKKFIEDLRLRSPKDLEEAGRIYEELSGPPLESVFASIEMHTSNIDPSQPVGLFPWEDVCEGAEHVSGPRLLRASDVTKEFAKLIQFGKVTAGGSGLGFYRKLLGDLGGDVDEALREPAFNETLQKNLRRALRDTLDRVSKPEVGVWSPRLKTLLVAPLEGLQESIEDGQGQRILDLWCQEIVAPMESAFRGRYPFELGARSNSVLKDVSDFYVPEAGKIAIFRKDKMNRWVEKVGARFQAPARGKSKLELNPAVIRFYDRAEEVSKVWFVDNEMRVEFELWLACAEAVERTDFVIGESPASYSCYGRDKFSLHWPGDKPDARFQAVGKDKRVHKLSFEGEWGMWRLFEEARVEKQGDWATFTFDLAKWNLGKNHVKVNVKPKGDSSAFFGADGKFLSTFRSPDVLPPRQLFVNGKSCPPSE